MTGKSNTSSPSENLEVRDAAAELLSKLAPKERAAVVLKDVFEMELKEIADTLGTTVGAVKAALHRGRTRLKEPDKPTEEPRVLPSRKLIDEFVAYYNERNLQGLLSLMLDSGSIELFGIDVETGRKNFERPGGWFHHNVFGPPGWPENVPYKARWETAVFRGEVVALVFGYNFQGREVLQSVMRFEEEEGLISNIRVYAPCPETVTEVAESLKLPVDENPYQVIAMIFALIRNAHAAQQKDTRGGAEL